ncbi:DUF6687 family protein [Aciditerrimonas ferrireducens]|uniref:DUF6687 family protein n=1 Tax=Aciditerrimonas ferrireducens TaxID=667306 RepID=UPI002006409C|nr:DUF6687 family protein [Aciditerrimonas ferrireducens]MCK4177931.1 hypothetical protein [Aciditerrimonas ferrireducens]
MSWRRVRLGERPLAVLDLPVAEPVAHVLVDGAPRARTVLTLSHWPGTPTPGALRADLSTEIALAAVSRRWPLPRRVAGATLDHLDVDGLLGLLVLAEPSVAEGEGSLLVEAARVGDFGVVRDPRAAMLAFGLAYWLGVDPMVGFGRAGARPTQAWSLVEALEVARRVLGWARAGADGEAAGAGARPGADGPAGLAEELAGWRASERALAAGQVVLSEEPERDLLVVRPRAGCWPVGGGLGDLPVHPAALHSASPRSRVCLVGEDRLVCWFRYETWVRLGRGRPSGMRPRVDLGPLAAELSAWPDGGGPWRFPGPAAVVPWLTPAGPVADPEAVLDRLRAELDRRDRQLPAWDPEARSPVPAAPTG